MAGQLREPVVAVGVTPATLESAAEAGPGQFERVLFPEAGSAEAS